MSRWPVLALTALLAAPTAIAAPTTKCDSCASCTAALANADASVELTADLKATEPTCVTIAGDRAEFIGEGHTLQTAGVGVRITAADVNLRRLTVRGAATGVVVTGARATLLGVTTDGAKIGLQGDGAAELRVVRSETRGGDVGLAFGPGATCAAGATVRSPGAVISHSQFSGAKVGIAACEAIPVIVATTVKGNGVGLRLGAPKPGADPASSGPWDPCVCAPGLAGVQRATTLFFSSGCGGCLVHEGWLPGVQAQGYDILMRPKDKAAQATYDAYIQRCAPEVTDAIGIPGCVPNYACPARHAVFKRRVPEKRIERDADIGDPEGMAEFAARCAAAAQAHLDGPACVAHAVRESTLCGNKLDVELGRPLTGADNACGKTQGEAAALGCGRPCP